MGLVDLNQNNELAYTFKSVKRKSWPENTLMSHIFNFSYFIPYDGSSWSLGNKHMLASVIFITVP